MNESRQPVREVEVSCAPLITIRLQRDESQCICAKRKREKRGGCAKLCSIALQFQMACCLQFNEL